MTRAWTGVYVYEAGAEDPHGLMPPNAFVARFEEQASAFSGEIREPDEYASGRERMAIVSGRRSGTQVTFDKLYLVGSLSHRVVYTGELSPDGRAVEGRWTIPGDWSGGFRMQRAANDQAVTADASDRESVLT